MYLTTGIKHAIKIKHEKITPKIKTPKCNIKIFIKINPLLIVKIDTNNNTGKKAHCLDLYTFDTPIIYSSY